MSDPASSLSQLTEDERRVLRLLGAGHTAKSIAAETQYSVHAINERLRDARRKTGAGSSRELARALLALENLETQENRDQKIGVERRSLPDDAGAVPPHSAAGRLRGSVVTGSIVIVALGAAAALMTGQGARRSGDAPIVVATTPARDTVIPAGPFTLSVTFDRAMMAGSMSFTTPDGMAAFPACAIETARQSADGRTYAMRCTAETDRRYVVGFNGPPYLNFRSRDGVAAVSTVLRFRTAP